MKSDVKSKIFKFRRQSIDVSKLYFYKMTCEEQSGKPVNLKNLIKGADWTDHSRRNIIVKNNINNEIVIEPEDEDYFGRIIRTKSKSGFFTKDLGVKAVDELDSKHSSVGDKFTDMVYFAFTPETKGNLIFIVEVQGFSPGMKMICDFFSKCFGKALTFDREPLKTKKTRKLLDLLSKSVKTINLEFTKHPKLPKDSQIEDVLEKLNPEEYQFIIGTTIRKRRKGNTPFFTLDKIWEKIFGNSLKSAIDEGVDLPAFLANINVEVVEGQSTVHEKILEEYQKLSIPLDKSNLDYNGIKAKIISALKKALADYET